MGRIKSKTVDTLGDAAPLNSAAGAEAWKHLPGLAEEHKEQEKWIAALSHVSRAGAGGTKPGLVGIRPNGMEGTRKLESFLPTHKKPKRQFEEKVAAPKEQPFTFGKHSKPRVILPETFCVDCGRQDRPPGGCINASHFDQNMPELGIKQNEILISFFCQECLIQQRADFTDIGSEVLVPVGNVMMSKKEHDRYLKLIRIKENTFNYIRAQSQIEGSPIFIER